MNRVTILKRHRRCIGRHWTEKKKFCNQYSFGKSRDLESYTADTVGTYFLGRLLTFERGSFELRFLFFCFAILKQ